MGSCAYCEPGMTRTPCFETHEDGSICTREKGYDGDHAACSLVEHPVTTWPQEVEA